MLLVYKIILNSKFEVFVFIAGKDIQEFPVKKVENLVDTNGAGDSFVGGILNKDLIN